MTRNISVPELSAHRFAAVAVVDNGQRLPELVEVSVVTIDHGAVSGTPLNWLVRPHQPINPLVTRGHGIGDRDVAGAPAWVEIDHEVEAVLGDRVLVAHRAEYCSQSLTSALPGWTPARVLDTRMLARWVWPTVAAGSLGALASRAGLDVPGTVGRAAHDAHAIALVFLTLAKFMVSDNPLPLTAQDVLDRCTTRGAEVRA